MRCAIPPLVILPQIQPPPTPLLGYWISHYLDNSLCVYSTTYTPLLAFPATWIPRYLGAPMLGLSTPSYPDTCIPLYLRSPLLGCLQLGYSAICVPRYLDTPLLAYSSTWILRHVHFATWIFRYLDTRLLGYSTTCTYSYFDSPVLLGCYATRLLCNPAA